MKNNCAGLSIVEALVSMVILMITLGGVYQIFQSNSLTYRMQEGLARVQENGRFAMDFLVKDIRMAGYMGCISDVSHINSVLDKDNLAKDDNLNYIYGSFGDAVTGFDADDETMYSIYVHDKNFKYQNVSGTWSTSSLHDISYAGVGKKIIPGTDVITIRKAFDDNIPVTKDPSKQHKAATIHTIKEHPFDIADVLMVSDCEIASIFQVTSSPSSHSITHNQGTVMIKGPDGTSNIEAMPGNEDKDLGKTFETGSFFWIGSFTYFISWNDSGNPALFLKKNNEPAQELVEGVENMQVLYGVSDGDFSVVSYVGATLVNDWSKVRGLKVAILVSSINKIANLDVDSDTYDLLGTIVGPADDTRIRRIFVSTVGLRNRLK